MADTKRTKKRPQSGDRAADGKYRPGHKLPGPGRAEGSRNKATIALEKMLADDGAGVVKAVIEKAKDGDMAAARLVLDRVIPVRKGRPIAIKLPKITTPADVLATLTATIDQMAAGEITPDEAAVVAGVLDSQRRAVELVDIEQRLARLEDEKGPKR